MIRIKIKAVIPILIITLLISACSDGTSDIPPNEKMSFTDKNGISFSLQTTPCSGNKSNGRITLSVNGEKQYLYSTDCGRTFSNMRSSEITLDKMSEGSCSFCITEKDSPENTTDIYTVYLNDISDTYLISVYAVSSPEKITGDGRVTLYIDDMPENTEYEATMDGWENFMSVSEGAVNFDDLGQGFYSAAVREKDSPDTLSAVLNVPVVHSEIGTNAFINAEAVLQTPELPTGCEVTALTMLLNYIGFDVDKLTLSDSFLPKGEYRKSDFNKVFVGDPRNRRAYGCTAGVIAETAENFLKVRDTDKKWQVKNITGCSPEVLYSAVKFGYPVVVWGSIDMEEIIKDYASWTDEATGNTVSWFGKEHCLLLTGFDMQKKIVYVNDPLKGETVYDMKVFEKRFEEMERNALIITEKY